MYKLPKGYGLTLSALLSVWLLGQPVLAQDTADEASENVQTETELNAETFAETDLIGRFWELGEDQKRGIFDLRTFHPNFILPVHYSSNPNEQPVSPTRG